MQTGNIYLQIVHIQTKIKYVMAKTSFLSPTANFEDILSRSSVEINNYVLKNNDSTLRKVYAFFQSDNRLLLLNGFSGTGKKQIAEHILSYMNKDTIVCRFVGTEASTLDDVLLNFYKTLKQKTSIKDNTELEMISSIKNKIEYIFSKLELKYVFVFYNFDSIKDDNRFEILNYIQSFSENDKIKTVITSKVFDTEVLPANYKYTKIIIKALSKEIFETYLRDCNIKVTTSMIEQLYRITRGYFLYTCFSIKIMLNQELTINNFIIQYSNSGMSFDEFLAKTYYALIVGTTKSVFNLFLKLHHGLNANALQNLGGYPDAVLKTLSNNYYIYKKGNIYYPTSFLKQNLNETVREEISKEKLAEYYEQQLELSPEDRDLPLSRETMTSELAFYTDTPIVVEDIPQETTQPEITSETAVKKDISHLENLDNNELFAQAKETFIKYDYISTLDILSVILSRKNDLQNSATLYSTYSMLAKTYTKLGKWKYALYYYDILEKYYKSVNDKNNLDLTKYQIAHIYYQSYQIFNAIQLLKQILVVSKDPQILADSNILLGNIALSSSNKELAITYYKEGISHIDANTNKTTALELFFKYAILSDEKNDINNAVEFYQRCIEINEPSSKYTALAYSNLGDLFYDNELYDEAKDCFEKAYNADKSNNNDYGMYYSITKLSELTDRKEKESRINMLIEAKEHAQKSRDIHAIIDSTLKLGDLYYDYSRPNNALSEYLTLYRAGKNSFSEYNLKKLKNRLEDIRAIIGKETFEKLAPDYE